MKRTDLPDRFQELLERIPYVTIATVSPDGQPWNSPVVGRFDEDMNLYWVSWQKNRHSDNIAREPRIFVVVFDSQAPEGTGEGLYMQMRARAIDTKKGIIEAAGVYDTSFFKEPLDHEQFLGDCPQRFYKAVPEKMWYNADGQQRGHFVDLRSEITEPVAA
ncbi:MAG TPA: pyridoxamine 5'-phosphate oxidase family protein [Patescibacteria group bacterium]|nr:pyridoxamine 5'-phosphate oxidase family protein [Patescibacteria group bacterium]